MTDIADLPKTIIQQSNSGTPGPWLTPESDMGDVTPKSPKISLNAKGLASTFTRPLQQTEGNVGTVQSSINESMDGVDSGQQIFRDVDRTTLKHQTQHSVTIGSQTSRGTESQYSYGEEDHPLTLVTPDLRSDETFEDEGLDDEMDEGITTLKQIPDRGTTKGMGGGSGAQLIQDLIQQPGGGLTPNGPNGTDGAGKKKQTAPIDDPSKAVIDNARKNAEEMAKAQIEMQNWQHREAINKAIMDAANNVHKMWIDILKDAGSKVAT